MRYARGITLAMALLALALLVLSGPGTRQGWWGWRTGLTLYQWAAYIGIAAALSAASSARSAVTRLKTASRPRSASESEPAHSTPSPPQACSNSGLCAASSYLMS